MEILEKVKAFLDIDTGGYGYDHSYGYGNGYGNEGIGNGYGNGNGHVRDDGTGNGYGNGWNNGVGGGDGFGYGNGSGIKEINGTPVYMVDSVPTVISNVRGTLATGYIVHRNADLIPCYIARVGNFFAHGKTAHATMKAAKEKYEEKRPLSERIDKFVKEFPTLDTTGTGKRFYEWHHVLTGSCEFGRKAFCERHNIDFERTYTVEFFLDITKNDYGGDQIRETRERYQ